jgi:thiamine biosynthesis lipoprotein
MKKLTRRDFIKISAAGAGVLALGGLGLSELMTQPELKTYSQTRALLGTFVTIRVLDTDYTSAKNMVISTFDEITRLSSIFSRFDASTELYSLNTTGIIKGASYELVDLIDKSIYFSELTDGSFDITTLPLLDLSINSFSRNNSPPSASDIKEAISKVGYKNIKISNRDITLTKSGSGITLDGIAVGYIVDKACSLLKENGIYNMMVNGGGEICTRGIKSDGTPWKIGIANPRGEGYIGIIDSDDFSVSTSGDYELFFTED